MKHPGQIWADIRASGGSVFGWRQHVDKIIGYLKFGRGQGFHPNKEEAVPEAWLIEACCSVMELKFPGIWAKTPEGIEP